jgi:hypothetical protein
VHVTLLTTRLQFGRVHAAAVPQDRRGATGDGDAILGEAGRHGGREPQNNLQPVQLAAAGRRMRLLGLICTCKRAVTQLPCCETSVMDRESLICFIFRICFAVLTSDAPIA